MGSAKGDFLVVLLLIVALGVAWVWTGGPARAISHRGGFFSAPWPIGTGGEAYDIPTVPLTRSPSGNVDPSDEAPVKVESAREKKTNLLNYFLGYRPGVGPTTDPAVSPYASYVRLEKSKAGESDPKKEYVTIRVLSTAKQSVTLTGWKLQSTATSLSVVIGPSAELPFLGDINYESPIVAGPKSVVVVTTGSSPNGASFRLNKCTGYFEQFQDFAPTLPKECPKPKDEMLLYPEKTASNQVCADYIGNIAQCTLVLASIPGNVGNNCQSFIQENLSYNGCIMKHKNEPDFYKDEWRVYLKRSQELWKNNHDRILLLDENGKLVSAVNY